MPFPIPPKKPAGFTENERRWIESQLAAEHQSTSEAGSHATGAVEALKDIRVWLFGLTHLLMLGVNYAYTLLPSLQMVRNLTALNDSLVGYIISAMGLLGAFGMIVNALATSDRSRKPYRQMILPAILEAICLFTVSFTIGPWLAVPVLAIMYFAHNAIQGPLLAPPQTPSFTAKGAAAGLATINMVGILGGVLGPPFMGWARDLTGSYQSGLAVRSH